MIPKIYLIRKELIDIRPKHICNLKKKNMSDDKSVKFISINFSTKLTTYGCLFLNAYRWKIIKRIVDFLFGKLSLCFAPFVKNRKFENTGPYSIIFKPLSLYHTCNVLCFTLILLNNYCQWVILFHFPLFYASAFFY